jgi:hypothetical protein
VLARGQHQPADDLEAALGERLALLLEVDGHRLQHRGRHRRRVAREDVEADVEVQRGSRLPQQRRAGHLEDHQGLDATRHRPDRRSERSQRQRAAFLTAQQQRRELHVDPAGGEQAHARGNGRCRRRRRSRGDGAGGSRRLRRRCAAGVGGLPGYRRRERQQRQQRRQRTPAPRSAGAPTCAWLRRRPAPTRSAAPQPPPPTAAGAFAGASPVGSAGGCATSTVAAWLPSSSRTVTAICWRVSRTASRVR